MKVDTFVEKALFRCASSVAREEHAEMAILQHKRNRVIVDRVFPTDERERWPDELQRNAIVAAPYTSGSRIYHRHAFAARDIERIVVRMAAVRLAAIGELCDAQFA